MSVEPNRIDIEDVIIKSTETERRINGYIIVKGTCKVKTGDFGEEDFIMDFVYEGKPNEPKSKLLDHLKIVGWRKCQEKFYKAPETLMDLINSQKYARK